MCGIFGWSFREEGSGVTVEQKVALSAVLQTMNDLRGGDSWGYWTPDGEARGLGDIVRASALAFARSNLVLAHTRKATTGGKVVENAHPFKVGAIIGAHNGIIYNHRELSAKYKRDCAVDSMHLFHHLEAGLGFEEIEGYGAIEWVDTRVGADRVHLCRMRDGDLSVFGVGKDPDNVTGVIWSSDEDHLEAAVAAAGLTGKGFNYSVEEGVQHYVRDGVFWVLKEAPKLTLTAGSWAKHDWRDGGVYSGWDWDPKRKQYTHKNGGVMRVDDFSKDDRDDDDAEDDLLAAWEKSEKLEEEWEVDPTDPKYKDRVLSLVDKEANEVVELGGECAACDVFSMTLDDEGVCAICAPYWYDTVETSKAQQDD